MKKMKWALALILTSTVVFGSSNRIVNDDQLQSADTTKTWSMPSITDTLTGIADAVTLTNKTISGASNTITNLNASSITGGSFGVAQGGTGLATIPAFSLLAGNGTSAVATVAPGAQYTVLQSAGASANPVYGALNLAQSAAVTGTLPVANGGTGAATLTANSILVGAGTSAVTGIAPGTSGNILASNGTTWVSQAMATSSPSVVGSTASPSLITAAGGVAFTGSNYNNFYFIAGSAAAVTVTASPQIAAGSLVGQRLELIGESATNTVTLQDGTGLSLNGKWVGALQSHLSLVWDGTVWSESSRR